MEKENKDLDRNLKLVFRASFIVFIILIIGKIFVYLYRIIIARSLGPEIYGLFSLAIMVTAWFAVFSSLGFSEGLSRYIPIFRGKKRPDNIKYIFRFTLKSLIVSSMLGGIILFFLSEFIAINIFHNSDLTLFLKFFSLAIPLIVIAKPFIAALRSYEKITWHAFISYIFHNAINVIFLIILLSLGLSISAVIFSYLLGLFVTFISAYLICKHVLPIIFKKDFLITKEKKRISKEFTKYSLPLLFSGVVGYIYLWIDSFSIGFFKSAVEVGFYNAAMPIAMLLAIAPELFMQLFFPLINKEYAKKNIKLIKDLSKQVGKWIFIINIPLFILIFIFPGAIINILFGAEYLPAENALRILVITTFLLSILGTLNRKLISMTGKSRIILFNTILAASMNLVLNFILVPMEKIWFIENSNGLTGAAIATLITAFFVLLIYSFQVRHYLSFIPLKKKMIPIFLVALVSAMVLLFIKQFFIINFISLVLLSIFFVLLYITLIFITKSLDRNDLLIIYAIKNKFLTKVKV